MGRRALIWIVLVVVAFLLGFVPQYIRARSLDSQLSSAREQMQFCQVKDLLGQTFVQTTVKNYGLASGSAARFFDRAAALASATGNAAWRKALNDALAKRDEVTAALARGDQAALSLLQPMYDNLPPLSF